VSAYNAFVIWREVNPSWRQANSFNRRHFLEDLGVPTSVPFYSIVEAHSPLPSLSSAYEESAGM